MTATRQRDRPAANPLAPRYWFAWAVVGLLRLVTLLPYGWQVALGRRVGRIALPLMRRQRCIAATNLELCFPGLGQAARAALLRRCFESIGIMLFEMPLAWWGDQDRLNRLMTVEGAEHLEQAVREGRGVILLSAHFSTLEISGRLFQRLHPLSVSYRDDRNPVLSRLSRRGRERHYRNVTPREDVRALIRQLREGNILWFAPDENYARDNRAVVDFMGVPAASNPATARFAKLGNAAVVPCAALRREDGRGYRLVLRPPLDGFPGGDPIADTARINAALSDLVRLAPEQYLWVQKRFLHGVDGQLTTYDHC